MTQPTKQQDSVIAALENEREAFSECFQALIQELSSDNPIRQQAEELLSKAGQTTYTCGNCGNTGHNARTCGKPKPKRNKTRGRPKKSLEDYVSDLENKHPGMLDLLGNVPDPTLAERYSVTRQRVHQIRKRLGIDKKVTPFTPTPEQVNLLGTRSDKELADLWGISNSTVSTLRRDLGIPVWSPWIDYAKKLEPHKDKIGKISDPKVAALAGVPTRIVYLYRQNEGIKTEVLSSAHEDFDPIDRDEIKRLFNEGWSDKEISEAVGGRPTTIGRIRTKELRLLRRKAPRRSNTQERSRILLMWEECEGNLSETARRTKRSPSFVREVVFGKSKDP